MAITSQERQWTAAVPRALSAILGGAIVALLALACFRWLAVVDPASGVGWAQSMARGNIGPLLLSGHFWSQLPSAPSLHRFGVLASSSAAMLVGGVVALSYVGMRLLLRGSWTRVGLASLAITLTPLLMLGALPIEAPPARILGWLRVMLCASLYAGLFAIVFGVLDLLRPWAPGERASASDAVSSRRSAAA